ncbi:MAG: YggS family pyridoxal phosphate-dependent enzyme [bacterium]
MSIKENIEKIRAKLLPGVKLVAVIKNVPLPQIFEAIEAGITDLGENKIQEAVSRAEIIKKKYPAVTFHLIGHLQTNKVRQALDTFAIIQSVDSRRLVEEINKRAEKPVPILIEVNTSGDETKYGVSPSQIGGLVAFAAKLEKIKIQGLMTMGPLSGGLEGARRSFRQLKKLSEEIANEKLPGVEMKYLSMGMTDDHEVAVEEGSNLVRIGRGIFGG